MAAVAFGAQLGLLRQGDLQEERALRRVQEIGERDAQGRIGEAAARLAEFDLAYGQAARLLEAVFTYSGRDDLARRLRRPRRRPRKPAPGRARLAV